jgi:hypothetical protein
VAPTLRDAGAAGNISDVDVEQQLLGESAGGYSLPDVHLPDFHLPDVPLQMSLSLMSLSLKSAQMIE